MSGPPLTPALVVHAYRQGIFPMADDAGEIGWYAPRQRAVFPLDGLRVPKSLAKVVKAGKFNIRINTDFAGVVAGCADRDSTWISGEIARVYGELHQLGIAHSVEAWQDGVLVGGLYGVSLGGAFMGESMFSRATDASKVCLVHLVERMQARGYMLLDSQTPTDHLLRYGQVLIPQAEYLRQLAGALLVSCQFVDPQEDRR